MGFEKTYIDTDGDTLLVESVVTDGDSASAVYFRTSAIGFQVSAKRARKIALAILAAADDAESVDAVGNRSNGGMIVEHDDDGDKVEVGAPFGTDPDDTAAYVRTSDAGAFLTKRAAKRIAFAILRAARQ